MSNVNHRYSSQSWTLDLSGKRSPLSRWTGRDVLRHEQFRLSLLGAEGGMAPVVWLAGDRPCFEDFHQTVEAYVQRGLSQPVLVGQSSFPAAPAPMGDRAPGATTNPTSTLASAPATPSQFSLAPLGLLRHRLHYQPQDSSPPRQMQLSTLQLADLLAVLDQWQNETLALPEGRSHLHHLQLLQGGQEQDFVVPTWARIAASLVVALGATGLGALLLSQQFPSATQVALESPNPEAGQLEGAPLDSNGDSNGFSGFPTAAGPPLTSQAQPGDAPFQDPFVPPNGDNAGIPAPSIVFPPTNGAPAFSGDGVPLADGTVASQPSASFGNGTALLPGDATGAPMPPAPGGSRSSTSVAGQTENGRSPGSSASPAAEAESSPADAPLLTTQPNPAASAPPTSAKTANADTAASIAQRQSNNEIASAERTDSASNATPPAPAAAAPPAPQVTVANPLPANNQSQAIQRYLQSNWRPPAAIQQPLQYRLNVSSDGKLTKLEPLSPNAQIYINDANLPPLGTAVSGAAGKVQSTLVVTLTPSGQVNVAVEKATSTP